MKKCQYCNTVIDDQAEFCTNCGRKQMPVSPQIDEDYIRQQIYSIKSLADLEAVLKKYPVIAHNPNLATLYRQAKNAITKIENEERRKPSFDLWTWIRAGNSDSVLYENDKNPDVDKDRFMSLLAGKIRENGLPANVQRKKVVWDGGKEVTDEYIVDINDTSVINPFSIVVNFTKIGKFSFVRQNLFITPPNLPDVPGKIPKISGVWAIVVGLLLMLIAGSFSSSSMYSMSSSDSSGMAWGVLLLCIGGGIEFFKYMRKTAWDRWNEAWEQWQRKCVEYTFQNIVSGRLECLQKGVSHSIKQVCDSLYYNALVSEDHSKVDQVDLEAAIAKKKKMME